MIMILKHNWVSFIFAGFGEQFSTRLFSIIIVIKLLLVSVSEAAHYSFQ